MIASGPDSSCELIRNNYVRLFHRARKRIYIQTPYFVPDEAVLQALRMAALSGVPAICEYLGETSYRDGAEALKESASAFERWCDNLIIEHIKPQKVNPFTVGPLAAYILARKNEIKCVRMVLSGKQSGLPDEIIRERLREMYV